VHYDVDPHAVDGGNVENIEWCKDPKNPSCADTVASLATEKYTSMIGNDLRSWQKSVIADILTPCRNDTVGAG
jgi:hypothetical protein